MPGRDILLRAAKAPFSTGGVDGDWLFRWWMVAHNIGDHPIWNSTVFRVIRTLGVVRGIVVRSRSVFGTIGAGLNAGRWKHYFADEFMREDASRKHSI